MRATWQGYISLGHVGVPVKLYSTTKTIRPRFMQLHKDDLKPVERVTFCKGEQKEISKDDIIRAVSHNDELVPLTQDELDAVSGPRIQTIEIRQFVDPGQIPPIYYNKSYYIVPDEGGQRAYALIREVLARSGKAALTQFAIHNKEHIGAIQAFDSLLVLYQLRFAEEIVSRRDVKMPALEKPTPQELAAGTALIDKLTGPLFIEDYHDEQTERIQNLIERKSKGLPPPKSQAPPSPTESNDLIHALTQSLDSPPNHPGLPSGE